MKKIFTAALGFVVLAAALVWWIRSAMPHQELPSTQPPPPPTKKFSPPKARALTFSQPQGWRADPSCTDVSDDDGCISQWRSDDEQVARVFAVPVLAGEPTDLSMEKVRASVVAQGGIAERMQQNGVDVVRIVQPAGKNPQGEALVSIGYMLALPGAEMFYVVSSLSLPTEQEKADAALHALLERAMVR